MIIQAVPITAIAPDAAVIHDLDELKVAVRRFPESIGYAYMGVFYLVVGETLVAVWDEGYSAEMLDKIGDPDDPTSCTIATKEYTASHKFEQRSGHTPTTNVPGDTPGERLVAITTSLRRTCSGCPLGNAVG